MLRLYGSARSRAVRVLWMLGELGLKYDHKDWLPRSPETKTPEYLALNANARVPTIDDDGFILSESMAINFYLAVLWFLHEPLSNRPLLQLGILLTVLGFQILTTGLIGEMITFKSFRREDSYSIRELLK